MDNLFKANYDAVVKRGLITPETTLDDFIDKCYEEYWEVREELMKDTLNEERFIEEITDLMNVCICCLIHIGRDPEIELKKCLKKNLNRCK